MLNMVFGVTKTISLIKVFDTTTLNLIISLEILTCVKFCISRRRDWHKEFVHFGFLPICLNLMALCFYYGSLLEGKLEHEIF